MPSQPYDVDHKQQRASYFCTFPRFPVRPSGGTVQGSPPSPPRFSSPRAAPAPLPGSDRHPSQRPAERLYRPRILPVVPVNLYSPDSSPPTQKQHPRRQASSSSSSSSAAASASYSPVSSPPKASTRGPSNRTVFFSSAKVRPLRLVQESRNRKRRPPVFYAHRSHALVQSLTYITIHQHQHQHQHRDALPPSPPPPTAAAEMATNPVMPKVDTTLPSIPSAPNSARPGDGDRDRILADLRRQVTIPTYLPTSNAMRDNPFTPCFLLPFLPPLPSPPLFSPPPFC